MMTEHTDILGPSYEILEPYHFCGISLIEAGGGGVQLVLIGG